MGFSEKIAGIDLKGTFKQRLLEDHHFFVGDIVVFSIVMFSFPGV